MRMHGRAVWGAGAACLLMSVGVSGGDTSPSPARQDEAPGPARALWDERLEGLPDTVRAAAEAKLARMRASSGADPQADAWAAFLRRRVGPGESYPTAEVMRIAAEERAEAQRRAARALQRGGDAPVPFIDSWQEMGPGNVGGRVRAMVFAPDVNPADGEDTSYMLAAGVAGGVFKSENGGLSWRSVSETMTNIAVSALAIDPNDPTVVWAGTGEGLAPGFNDDGGGVPGQDGPVGLEGIGLYRSTDSGETWDLIEETVDEFFGDFNYVNKIAIGFARDIVAGPDGDEEPQPHIYVAAASGLWRHEAGGYPEDVDQNTFSWVKVAGIFDNGSTDVVVVPPTSPGSADIDTEMLLATSDDGLHVSINGGDFAWLVDDEDADPAEVMRIDSPVQGRLTISVLEGDAGAPSWAYVLMARRAGAVASSVSIEGRELPPGAVVNIFRARLDQIDVETNKDGDTIDVNLDFQPVLNRESSAPLSNRLLLSDALFSGACSGAVFPEFSVGNFASIIKVDPTSDPTPGMEDTHRVWVGGVDLYRSDDGGQNFGIASYWYFSPASVLEVHDNQHEIVFHPEYDGVTNTTMYVANDGGVYRTDDTRGGVSAVPCPFIPGGDQTTMAWDDANDGLTLAQFYHGDTGNDGVPPPGVGDQAQTEPGRDLIVGGAEGNGTIQSLKRGCTEAWETIFLNTGGYVAVDPANNDRVYFGSGGSTTIRRAERINNVGIVSNISTGLDPVSSAFVAPLALDASHGTRRVLWYGGRRPWRTLNAEADNPSAVVWEQASAEDDPVLAIIQAPWNFSAIAVAPSDPNVVYMGTENGIIVRTTNALEPDPDKIVWEEISAFGDEPFNFGAYISSIAVDPDNPDVFWFTNSRFTFFGHVYRAVVDPVAQTTAFTRLDGTDCDATDDDDPTLPAIPATWIVLRRCPTSDCEDIGGPCLVIVGTDIGVYISDDAWAIDDMEGCDTNGDGEPDGDSVTWNLVNTPDSPGGTGSLPEVFVSSLDMRDENTIAAFTYGRGAWLGQIADTPRRHCNGQTEAPCNAADLAAPFGLLDLDDLTRFIEDRQAARASADIACTGVAGEPPCIQEGCGDGLLDLSDLTLFASLFAAGCP